MPVTRFASAALAAATAAVRWFPYSVRSSVLQSRGFAFAEFVSPQEAQNAHGALQHTHLLGRKLVIDYAEADTVDAEEELAKMQKKVAGQVNKVAMQQLTRRGRTKVNIGPTDEADAGEGDLVA